MTLTTILTGEDPKKGKYLVFGTDSRGETYFPITSDRMVKHLKINEKAGMIFAGAANFQREMFDLVLADSSIRGMENIYEISTKIAEKYRQVWESHVRPRRMRAEAYRMPMQPFELHVGVGGLDVEPRIYIIEEAGECTSMIDGYLALGSGRIYAKPKIEDWIRCAGGEFYIPTEIPKLSFNSALACTYYVIEDAKRRTSSVGGSTHISAITSEGWKDLDGQLPKLEPTIQEIMESLDKKLAEKIKLFDT